MNGPNWTGRAPRNVQQAFGTYTSREVAPMPHKPTRGERIADAAFAVTAGLAIAAGALSWLMR